MEIPKPNPKIIGIDVLKLKFTKLEWYEYIFRVLKPFHDILTLNSHDDELAIPTQLFSL